jgi:prepilin-type N-terminal cleavage/methylation domain-containing protein
MENREVRARTGMWRAGIFKGRGQGSGLPLQAVSRGIRGQLRPKNTIDVSVRPRTETRFTNKGFTLIELLVVILILSIIISFVVPRIIGNEEVELRGAARKLFYTVKKLSDDAVFRKEKMILNLDIDGRGYGDREAGNWVRLPDNVTIEEVILGKQGIRRGAVTITFFPSGLRDEITIRLSDREGKRRYDVHIPALGERFEISEAP